jgi:tRNA pseudouridine55 synthase
VAMHKKKLKRKINGIFLLNKPIDISSNKILQKVKHIFCAEKAGHTGTLDPLATGVLPIFFGRTTKFCQYCIDADKGYIATVKLGIATTTGDAEGDIVKTLAVDVSSSLLQKTLKSFCGLIDQVPSIYSALKYKGKKLYEYARQGIDVPIAKRSINIYKIELLDYNSSDTFTIKVYCSKGTYIRTLAEDIGIALGTVAHITKLHRFKAGDFLDADTITIEQLQDSIVENTSSSADKFITLDNNLLRSDKAVLCFDSILVNNEDITFLKQGASVKLDAIINNYEEDTILRIYAGNDKKVITNNEFIGLGKIKDNSLYPKCILHT